jgi:glycosyltransferase involved in cell wall biosynthesis
LKSLRVGQIIETLDMGGAENLAVRLANELAAEGHDSSLIILTKPGPLSERIDPAVHVHYLDFVRASVRNPIAFALSIRHGRQQLARVINENKIEVVQTHLPGSNFLGLLLELGGICPVLATIHNNEEFRYGETDNAILIRARKFAYSQLLSRGHGIVAVSEDVRTSFMKQLNCGEELSGRISVVTNAVPLPDTLGSDEKARLRDSLDVRAGVPFILAAGRLSEQKNFRDLISAAGELRDAGVEFQLIIGGEGELRPHLEKQVQTLGLTGQVQLPGMLGNLNQVMQAADIFVMSSLWEGLPLVLLEAMAAGLPSVAFKIPGIDEVIENRVEGLKVSVGNTGELATALKELLTDENSRLSMGAAASETIRRQYNFKMMIEQLAGLYADALQTTRR